MDNRSLSSSVWSPRSEGGVQELTGYPGRLMLAPTASMPTRNHSKSLDQLGPDLVTSHQPPVVSYDSPKTLPRSISTQLLGSGKQTRSPGRLNSSPATVPSRGKQRSIVPTCTSVFDQQNGKHSPHSGSSSGLGKKVEIYIRFLFHLIVKYFYFNHQVAQYQLYQELNLLNNWYRVHAH